MKKTIGTKLITYTKRLKLKIQSRVWNFKNTMVKKRRRKRKREKTNKEKQTRSQKLSRKYRYKIDNEYQKAKIKNLEQSLEFQKYNVKKTEEEN